MATESTMLIDIVTLNSERLPKKSEMSLREVPRDDEAISQINENGIVPPYGIPYSGTSAKNASQ